MYPDHTLCSLRTPSILETSRCREYTVHWQTLPSITKTMSARSLGACFLSIPTLGNILLFHLKHPIANKARRIKPVNETEHGQTSSRLAPRSLRSYCVLLQPTSFSFRSAPFIPFFPRHAQTSPPKRGKLITTRCLPRSYIYTMFPIFHPSIAPQLFILSPQFFLFFPFFSFLRFHSLQMPFPLPTS